MEHFIEECEYTKDWFIEIGKDKKEIIENLWSEQLDGNKGRILKKLWEEKEKINNRNKKNQKSE